MLGGYPVNLSLGKTNSCCAGDIGNPMLEIRELLNITLAEDEVTSVYENLNQDAIAGEIGRASCRERVCSVV